MKITQTLLGAFLMVQGVAAGVLMFQQHSTAAVRPDEKLLALDIASVDKLVIEDAEGKLELQKSDDSWILSEHAVPVVADKAEQVLETLQKAKTGWAIANREESHDQLQVAVDNFNRKLSLYSGDNQLTQLYVGSSPGLRQSHVRRADESEVYSVRLNNYEVPATSNQWLERNLMTLTDVTKINFNDHTLELIDDQWELSDAEGQSLKADPSQLENVVSRLTQLRVQDVAATGSIESIDTPAAELEVTAEDQQYSYQFFSASNNYWMVRSDHQTGFKISEADYEALAMADIDSWLVDEKGDVLPTADGGADD